MKRLSVLEVDLMLALRHFMMGRLNLKIHLLQGQADLPSSRLTMVQRSQIKVPRLVVRLGGRLTFLIGLEQEKLRFWSYIEPVEAHILSLLDHPLEHIARVAHKGASIGIVHVTDQAGHFSVLRPPRKNTEAL